MDTIIAQKQLSKDEKVQIDQQVKAELVDHLYRGCLPGTIGGIPVGIAYIINLYGHTPFNWLLSWSIYYFLALFGLGSLYFLYKRFKPKENLHIWLIAYAVSMSLCAAAWGSSILLIPADSMIRQYVVIIALLIFSNGYAAGTIGVFELCIVTLTIIMVPLMSWSFFQGEFFYNSIGFFVLIYYFFLIGINRRSTQWFKDSLKLKLENTLVSYQANHDLLTHLPNQRMLAQFVEASVEEVKDTPNTFALFCFSLNRMEVISDSLGHHAGDAIIKSVANRLNNLAELAAKNKTNPVHYIITISRKDTFNILVVPITPQDLENKANMLFTVLEEPFYVKEKGVRLTASIGASLYKRDGTDTQTLLANADAAMLRAKQFGGNRVECYKAELNAQLPHQLTLDHDLHQALKMNQFQVYYQPFIHLETGVVSGMEALIRWPHPIHGFISPIQFIPLAEENGLIIPIGAWVLEQACKQTLIWHQQGYPALKVAVNLSAKQLRQDNLLEVFQGILNKIQFNSHFLELEITETLILDETVTAVLKKFNELGMSLAVDDFGTGYSGLSYLKRFSINKLKIDQSFIRDIPTNTDSMAIVSAIIAMAKELKIKILAEGIETREQLEFLRSKGCDYGQGYFFSKPLESNYFSRFLENQRDQVAWKS